MLGGVCGDVSEYEFHTDCGRFARHAPHSFYVALYAAFYVPGLPLAVFQQLCDQRADARFTTLRAQRFRGVLCFSLMLVSVLWLLWDVLNPACAGACLLLGMASWTMHGSTSQLAQMCGRDAIVAQQAGPSEWKEGGVRDLELPNFRISDPDYVTRDYLPT